MTVATMAAMRLPTLEERTETMPTIVCPSCESSTFVDEVRRDATSFCPNETCGYPLFWSTAPVAAGAVTSGEPVTGDTGIARRSPGVEGRMHLVHIPCPDCNELNAPDREVCVRCEIDLHPVIVVAEAPEPEPVPEVVAVEESGWAAWILVAVLLLFLAGIGVWAWMGM